MKLLGLVIGFSGIVVIFSGGLSRPDPNTWWALFAMLTAVARLTKLFQEYRVEELFTFFDLCKLLGFEQVTITDGYEFAHQVIIK